ncbi:MAG TPA: DNA-directed RNA polymerase subunit omega [Candidatus Scatomonas pullistercoris]|uniref:DNA-directed RNA polymerase subunit omega n=1 Tax=Candidatus Scatomonas pullistercoris TaxID=2840920 RepID=A0A9D1P203_9FIRM|nr:DNA-directed RNA polymerase subunit omega [Candidatus Scatomonas pullistercoris]
MIHPSYQELIEAINAGQEMDEEPLVTSRYSIVLATSKRARQLIAGAQPMVRSRGRKALSVAVEEIYKGKVKILPQEETEEEE